MNPGKKKNPLSSDKSWQFPKGKPLDTYLMRKKMEKREQKTTLLPASQNQDTIQLD